jgi:uncharacterized protein YdeI (YjbR/CyaY-like superfamily)
MNQDLPIVEFKFRSELRSWLESNHNKSSGVYVRLFKKDSGIISVTFEELLDEGLCFGWSESQRLTYDDKSYLQKFTPRRSKGTTSQRNKAHIKKLINEEFMTPSGLAVLNPKDLE